MFRRERVEKEYSELCRKHGLGLTTFAPLRRGILTGKYNHGKIPEGTRADKEGGWFKDEVLGGAEILAKVEKLKAVANRLGEHMGNPVTTGQLALAWTIKNENVSSAIIGATSVSQLEENLAALELILADSLSQNIMEDIDEILKNKPILEPRRHE